MPETPAPRRLLLLFGTVISGVNLVAWTAVDYARYGVLTGRGLRMAMFALSATLALYLVLRLALLVVGKEAA
jgi:hypothetical protein